MTSATPVAMDRKTKFPLARRDRDLVSSPLTLPGLGTGMLAVRADRPLLEDIEISDEVVLYTVGLNDLRAHSNSAR